MNGAGNHTDEGFFKARGDVVSTRHHTRQSAEKRLRNNSRHFAHTVVDHTPTP